MSQLLYFDPFNGASGDMILGALIDLGVPLDHLRTELAKLKIEEWKVTAREVVRQGLKGVNLNVHPVQTQHGKGGHQDEKGGHHHEHHHEHRGFTAIRDIIERSELHPWVKEKAVSIFQRLGEAEAKVHQTSLEDVHFHEVGAVDSIVDIVGACIGFQYLGVESFFSAPLNLGGGTVSFSHGTWPVPTPATAELLVDFPSYISEGRGELTTPTGAAIISSLVKVGQKSPICNYHGWGLGAGDAEFEDIPNMLRLLLGKVSHSTSSAVADEAWGEEEICLLEANIDDMDAETLGYFLELALENQALDAYCTSLHMKKSRPGIKLSVLCRPQQRERMVELFFAETTTLGVRWSPWQRSFLAREERQVKTDYGEMRVKIARSRGKIVRVAPEYESLKTISQASKIPMRALREKVISQVADLIDE